MRTLQHSARTTQAAYWAAVTTLIVMQSTLGAPVTVSLRRFIGTILGAGLGALLSTLFGPNILAFGIGIFCPRHPVYVDWASAPEAAGIPREKYVSVRKCRVRIVMLVVRYN